MLIGAAMNEPSYFHIGVLVPDLDKAMEEMSRQHGVTFPTPAAIRLSSPDGSHEDLIRVVYSKDGAPYYELIEATADGVFGGSGQEKIHHVGIWEEDMAGRVKLLRENGVGVMASGVGLTGRPGLIEDATPHWVITEPNALGIRFEYVDLAMKMGIEMWLETGEFPGGAG
jgi:hypothetical protein